MPSLLLRGGTYLVTHPHSSALRGNALAVTHAFKNGFLLAENGIIVKLGPLESAPDRADTVIDCGGKYVLPCWCDSHTHLVFAQSREEEFVYRIQGMSYEEIAAKGGGILNSARKLQEMPEELLFDKAQARLSEVIAMGTGAIEIKSGYGLTTDSELKMLRVIRRLKEQNDIPIKATFLGAHAIPKEYGSNRKAYIDLLIDEMLPLVSGEGLADYIDVFCDRGFFAVDECDRILEAGAGYGLKPKIHVSELGNIGGVQSGIRHQAVSVDHLECATEVEAEALGRTQTIATLLPSCAFFLGLPFPPARQLAEAGAGIALATDFNPGTSPSGNMSFVVSLACIKMGMLPIEAIHAATINGACAMESADVVGSLAPGKRANLLITKPISSEAYIPYAFGAPQIDSVLINGRLR